MIYKEYHDAQEFLNRCLETFESNEVYYSLMLGLSKKLVQNPLHYGDFPLMATVEKDDQLLSIALMTPPFKLQISLVDENSKDALSFLAQSIYDHSWRIPTVMGEAHILKTFIKKWLDLNSCLSLEGERQRIYGLTQVIKGPLVPGFYRIAKSDEFDLIMLWQKAFHLETFGEGVKTAIYEKLVKSLFNEGHLYIWDDQGPVSMAALTRPTSHGITVSYVYTPNEHRKKGYASAIVSEISQMCLEQGKVFCSLFTDLSNATSNGIYQKIGYQAVADVIDIHFVEP
ncbi:GNAT family N-acetyltransferase [bacterium]|nr:GNAT family N-acetyltransferase [bacterium]